MEALKWAAAGTGFTFFMTMLGSAMVFFFRKKDNINVQRIFLGFAAGGMTAAAVWSLLIPSIESTEEAGGIGWIPAAGGFLLGVAFMMLLDYIIPHLHIGSDDPEGVKSSMKRTSLLIMAVTLHNIPEGIAVGLYFAMAAQQGGDPALYTAALALAIGMGIQNFPEGAAVSVPLAQDGFSRKKAFLFGSLSGLVEPVFGIAAVLIASGIQPFMPWLLAFAAGTMIYVVVEELIPEAHLGEHSNIGTLGVMAGFVIMMILDVALG